MGDFVSVFDSLFFNLFLFCVVFLFCFFLFLFCFASSLCFFFILIARRSKSNGRRVAYFVCLLFVCCLHILLLHCLLVCLVCLFFVCICVLFTVDCLVFSVLECLLGYSFGWLVDFFIDCFFAWLDA